MNLPLLLLSISLHLYPISNCWFSHKLFPLHIPCLALLQSLTPLTGKSYKVPLCMSPPLSLSIATAGCPSPPLSIATAGCPSPPLSIATAGCPSPPSTATALLRHLQSSLRHLARRSSRRYGSSERNRQFRVPPSLILLIVVSGNTDLAEYHRRVSLISSPENLLDLSLSWNAAAAGTVVRRIEALGL